MLHRHSMHLSRPVAASGRWHASFCHMTPLLSPSTKPLPFSSVRGLSGDSKLVKSDKDIAMSTIVDLDQTIPSHGGDNRWNNLALRSVFMTGQRMKMTAIFIARGSYLSRSLQSLMARQSDRQYGEKGCRRSVVQRTELDENHRNNAFAHASCVHVERSRDPKERAARTRMAFHPLFSPMALAQGGAIRGFFRCIASRRWKRSTSAGNGLGIQQEAV